MGGRRRRRRSGAGGDLRWQLRRLCSARRYDVHARCLRLRCRRRGHLEPGLVLRDRAAVLEVIRHRSEEHTSELQSLAYLVCRLLLEKKKKKYTRKLRL